MTSLFAAVALMSLLPATPPPHAPGPLPPRGALLLDGALPREESPQPDALHEACTCKCGSVYSEIDTQRACEDLEGEACVTKQGALATLEDCAVRFVGKAGEATLQPEIINPGGPM